MRRKIYFFGAIIAISASLVLCYNWIDAHIFANGMYCLKPKKAGNNNLYSQYFEDFILSIVFADVQKGVYIDVGANDPDKNSVTKYFYLKGWRGLNIDPIEKHYLNLLAKRPEDINLNIGIANLKGSVEFYHIFPQDDPSADGLSTFDKASLQAALKDGYIYVSKKIQLMPLNEVLENYSIKDINFISIDTEGTEKEVLQSINLSKYRPQIFIIEAVKPRTFEACHEQWESILLDNGYIFVMFDGLNRYYIAQEYKGRLLKKFRFAYQCAKEANTTYNVIDNKLYYNSQ